MVFMWQFWLIVAGLFFVGEIFTLGFLNIIFFNKRYGSKDSNQLNDTNIPSLSIEQEVLADKEETDLANKKNADLFVSIHLNSSEYEANGYEIYCDFNNKNTVKLSNSILKQLDQLYYSTNRGLLDTNETPLYVVKNNKVDSILIEAGFISDDSDLYYLKNHTKNIAIAIAKGIKKSLS